MVELLRTEGLTKRFEGLLANDRVDFRLESSELFFFALSRRSIM
jgi:ABC-type branched-subunit amino acid transport system ATPase component